MFRIRCLLPVAALIGFVSYAAPAPAQTIVDGWAKIKPPAPPELKPVTLEPKTTALLVMDLIKQACNENARPRCVASIPNVAKLLAAARASSVTVIYTIIPSAGPNVPVPVIGD